MVLVFMNAPILASPYPFSISGLVNPVSVNPIVDGLQLYVIDSAAVVEEISFTLGMPAIQPGVFTSPAAVPSNTG